LNTAISSSPRRDKAGLLFRRVARRRDSGSDGEKLDRIQAPSPIGFLDARADDANAAPLDGFLKRGRSCGPAVSSLAVSEIPSGRHEDGAIRWYHRFPGAWPIEAKQQPNGHITVYVGRSFGWQPIAGGYVELTPAGDVVRTYAVAGNDYTDPHELLLSFRDTTVVASHLLGYEIQSFDLSAMGGSPTAPLAVHTIERRSASGAVLFRWSAGSAFTVGDWPLPNPHALDLVHPSSLAIDRDSNYVVSFQAMDQVVKIDATTGATMWRLGGRRNQFQILDDPLGGFTGQHNVQVLENGNLLMMDDRFRGVRGPARAVEYSLDATTMVARMVWQYQPATAVISPIMGSVQRLANGATLVGFGAAGRVDEVEADGSVLRNATLRNDAMAIPFYRAVRIRSLYASVPLR